MSEKRSFIEMLKEQIQKLRRENRRLRSDLRTYESAFHLTGNFLRDYTGKFNVEDTIEAARDKITMEEFAERKRNRRREYGQ